MTLAQLRYAITVANSIPGGMVAPGEVGRNGRRG